MLGRSGNPTLNENTFERSGHYNDQETMTIGGTVNKSFMLLALLIGAAVISWVMFFNGYDMFPLMVGGAIGGFVLALIISFAPKSAPFLAPIYAVAEGLFLGALSANYESLYYGITLQAALLTMCVFLGMLLAYKTGLIKASPGFRRGIIAATAGVMWHEPGFSEVITSCSKNPEISMTWLEILLAMYPIRYQKSDCRSEHLIFQISNIIFLQ